MLLAAVGLLLSGCASMPDGGKVDHVDSSHRTDSDSQVRVFSVSPQKGETPQQIVRGFLEATTSDEAAFGTARQYLTDEARDRWDPFARTTVLSEGPSAEPQGHRSNGRDSYGGDDGPYTVRVSGPRMAIVDRDKAYAPRGGTFQRAFDLVKVGGEWRIDRLPDGLVLGESDFQRIYRPINTYYYARLAPDVVEGGQDVLVADPVYLRRRIDPVTQTVTALLKGPSDWLRPVVTSAFPRGSALAPRQRLSLDDSGALTVRLNEAGAGAERGRCVRMAAQTLHTVQNQASAKVSKVALEGPDGEDLCSQTREQAEEYEPGRLNGRAEHQYFIDKKHRVSALAGSSERAKPVTGPLGSGETEMGGIAVNRVEEMGAAVSRGRGELYVSSLEDAGPLPKPLVTSGAKREEDRLSVPSWDGLGDLWVADRDPDGQRLLRSRGGEEKPQEVRVPGLGKDRRIESLKVSSDGVRIALRIREPDGDASLRLGRVERYGSNADSRARIADLRPLAPQLEDVVAASWAGGSTLVVVGRQSGSVQQLQYLETDGSVSNQPALPGINDVTGVAASEDQSKPLLADSEDGIVRLPPDANWKRVTDGGSAPAYPG
ncbi:LpqB family beta-propeller domain-containing protein [Streptomyces sp. AJS327]|uniref:LpqB family beta-propeller domain-containing protein n=1 Tax=Streptomyces sp. AJS327 TaxID=2545265 RepID=UPI0027E51573|nr:LpqB family beta-propeller domain-containing protein [Streptomyces sp. AJS327]